MPRRKRSPLLFGVYEAFKADRNDDGGVGGRRIGFHAQTRTALWIIAEAQHLCFVYEEL